MKSEVSGKNISKIEITNISIHGIWLLFSDKEYFLPYSQFPWFKDSKLSEIQNIKIIHKDHLYWPELDVDLSKNILDNLESYPLTFR
ncbi:MAG: DUF2442 domain-containing protein [Chitinispirillia bacterium]|jgi:hypothetical protein